MQVLVPIGQIRTPFTQKKSTPIQPNRSQAVGRVELLPEYEAGLQDLAGFSHIILLYLFHQSDRCAGFSPLSFTTRRPSRNARCSARIFVTPRPVRSAGFSPFFSSPRKTAPGSLK